MNPKLHKPNKFGAKAVYYNRKTNTIINDKIAEKEDYLFFPSQLEFNVYKRLRGIVGDEAITELLNEALKELGIQVQLSKI